MAVVALTRRELPEEETPVLLGAVCRRRDTSNRTTG